MHDAELRSPQQEMEESAALIGRDAAGSAGPRPPIGGSPRMGFIFPH